MPYQLSTPRAFFVDKPTQVSITRLRIIGISVELEPDMRARTSVELQSGSGPYTAEESRDFTFTADSTARILNASASGVAKTAAALERAVFDELARLGIIPNGTVS
jgi:hypothetical protein